MAAPALSDLWLVAPEGKLCAREQAKAWALREAWRAEGKGAYGLLSFVAAAYEMFDVDGLCRELPQRLKALRQTGGDRIAK